MINLVLVTRPIEQAREFAAEIEKIGLSALIQPLLDIEDIPYSFQNIKKPDAILLTSIHGLGQASLPENWVDIPVFTVGLKTEEIASKAGLKNIYAGRTDISDVYTLIQKNLPIGSHVLYLRGEHIKQDIPSALPDFYIQEKITYSANEIDKIEDKVLHSFDKIDVLTLFSPRTGKILMSLLEKYELRRHVKSIKLLCLSQAVLESAKELPWKSCYVADNPTPESMIETLERLRDE